MATFKYNKEKLIFEKTYKVLKYKVVSVCLLLFFAGTLISAIQLKTEKEVLKQVIKQKDKRIETIVQPIREETYVEDLYKNIGFTLTDSQFERFSELALKYRNQIEEAKVPATLVWWVAYKESRFNVKAESNSSTAKGMYQFLDGTWNGVCKLKGFNRDGRFKEEKQVKVMLAYLNYLYGKYGSWEKSMVEYCGGEYQYPILFLFK